MMLQNEVALKVLFKFIVCYTEKICNVEIEWKVTFPISFVLHRIWVRADKYYVRFFSSANEKHFFLLVSYGRRLIF